MHNVCIITSGDNIQWGFPPHDHTLIHRLPRGARRERLQLDITKRKDNEFILVTLFRVAELKTDNWRYRFTRDK